MFVDYDLSLFTYSFYHKFTIWYSFYSMNFVKKSVWSNSTSFHTKTKTDADEQIFSQIPCCIISSKDSIDQTTFFTCHYIKVCSLLRVRTSLAQKNSMTFPGLSRTFFSIFQDQNSQIDSRFSQQRHVQNYAWVCGSRKINWINFVRKSRSLH